MDRKNDEVMVHEHPDCIELVADFEHTSVPLVKLEELIQAETERDILRRAYMALDSFRLEYVMIAIFGPKPKVTENDAE